MFTNILLGIDGSSHATKAAVYAGELARLLQADLRIVVAFDPIPVYLGEPFFQEAIDKRLAQANQILREAIQSVGQTPKEITTEILEGSAAEVLLNVAETRNNDLIILGARGLGRLAALLLGSQSQKVIQHAPCPVLVIR